jgi:hypothetical protein
MSAPINCFVIAALLAAVMFATKQAMACIALLSIALVATSTAADLLIHGRDDVRR